MGHFTLIVIGDDIEEQLTPYDEGLEVEPFREDFNEEDAADWAWWQETHPGDSGGGLFGSPVLSDDKGLSYMSTYNWDRRFDWWVVGGRWRGTVLRVKPTVVPQLGPPGRGDPPLLGYTDICRKGEVDWVGMTRDHERRARLEWRTAQGILRRHPPATPRSVFLARAAAGEITPADAHEEFGHQAGIVAISSANVTMWRTDPDEFLISEAAYVRRATETGPTHAVLNDGRWYQEGEDGAHEEWEHVFHGLVDDLPDDTLLTVLDCHL